MDGGDRRQSQYGAPYQSSGPERSAPRQAMGPPSQESFSQQPTSTTLSGMTAQTSARPYLPGYQFNYPHQSFQPSVQYQQTYLPDPPRSHQLQPPPGQQQQYQQYGQTMLPSGQQPSMYDSMSDYQQQQRHTAIEVMAGQFGAGSMSNYMPQAGPSGTSGMNQPGHYLSSQPEEQSYTSMAYGRPQLQPPFAPEPHYTMMDQPSPPQQLREEPGSRQAFEAEKRAYEEELAGAFEAIVNSRLNEASRKLHAATQWLVGSLLSLGMIDLEHSHHQLIVTGLHHDDEEQYSQRLKFWRELNHAWEALGLQQKQATEHALRTNQQPQDILTRESIRTLIDKLIQLCDQLEKYGLVDYELGIWEEQIVDIFIHCLDLLSDDQQEAEPT